jgi:hypothetical protein
MNDKIENNKKFQESSLRLSREFNNRSEYYTQDSFALGENQKEKMSTLILKNYSPILKPSLYLTADSNFLELKSITYPKIETKEAVKVDYKKLYNNNILNNRAKYREKKLIKTEEKSEKTEKSDKKQVQRRVYFNTSINQDSIISLKKEKIRSILKKGNSESKASLKRKDEFDRLADYQKYVCENTFSSCEFNDSLENKNMNSENNNLSDEKYQYFNILGKILLYH